MRAPLSIRPFLPDDAPALAELFHESVKALAKGYYDDGQRAAWAAAAEGEAFAQKLAEGVSLVALRGGAICGFATLREGGLFDFLYVRPSAARQGVGSALADAVEELARARSAKEMVVDASDAARDFFRARGYVARRRNLVSVGDERLANTTMKKTLEAPSPRERAS